MKHSWIALLCLALLACQGNTQQKAQLKTQKDSVSYAIGLDIGKNLKLQMIEVDPGLLGQGIRDIIDSNKTLLTDAQANDCISGFQQRMMAKHNEVMKAQADKNKTDGEKFLAENKTKEGVVTLPDGLQYKVIKMGTGNKPSMKSTVSVLYRGTLIDGTEFDGTDKHGGQPYTTALTSVIRGWSEALQLMPVGSKWMLYIPSELGYGARGAGGGVIGPNATLVFELELLEIKS